MLKKLILIGSVCGGLALLGLALIFLSGASYPDLMFRILSPLSLLLAFAAIPFLAASWVLVILKELRAKSYLLAALWLLGGLLLILRQLWRIL